jgi:threonine aldolase
MRQAGVLAAAGILSLQKGPIRLAQDHIFTKQLAVTAQEVGKDIVEVDLDTVETNMVMLKVEPKSGASPNSIVTRLAKTTEKEVHVVGQDIRLLAYPMTESNIRIVVHCSNTPEDIKLAQDKLEYVFGEIKHNA